MRSFGFMFHLVSFTDPNNKDFEHFLKGCHVIDNIFYAKVDEIIHYWPPTYLRLVNVVKERPPCLVCYLLLYQIHSDQWVQVISWFWRQKTCMYVSMNVMYNSCKNTSRWLLQTNLSRSKSGVQLWALTRLASKKRNKKPKRMMRVLIP